MWSIFRSVLIFLFLFVYIVEFVHGNTFANILCLSSASKMTGKFEDTSSCARECASTNGCQSFFYDSEERECYTVDEVLTSTAGCNAKSGVKYYINTPDNVDCYTNEDDNLVSQYNSYEDQCEIHPFNVYTDGNNEDYPGCGNCTCCKLKGCLHGNSRTYNGRWSKTNTGRQCQRWDSQHPHDHLMYFSSYYPLDRSIHDAHNYCRDPDYSAFDYPPCTSDFKDVFLIITLIICGLPWCYTVDPEVRWESCGILLCAMTHFKFVEA